MRASQALSQADGHISAVFVTKENVSGTAIKRVQPIAQNEATKTDWKRLMAAMEITMRAPPPTDTLLDAVTCLLSAFCHWFLFFQIYSCFFLFS